MAAAGSLKEYEDMSFDFLDRFASAIAKAYTPATQGSVLSKFHDELEKRQADEAENAGTLLWAASKIVDLSHCVPGHPFYRLEQYVTDLLTKKADADRKRSLLKDRKKSPLKKLVALWGFARIDHYQWRRHSLSTLQDLVRTAELYPAWKTFVNELNHVMIARHEATASDLSQLRIGKHPGKASLQDPASPLLRSDLILLRNPPTKQPQLIEKWASSCSDCVSQMIGSPVWTLEHDIYGMLVVSKTPRRGCDLCRKRTKRASSKEDEHRVRQKKQRSLLAALPVPDPSPALHSPSSSTTPEPSPPPHLTTAPLARPLSSSANPQTVSPAISSSPLFFDRTPSPDLQTRAPKDHLHFPPSGRHTTSSLRLPCASGGIGTYTASTTFEGLSADDNQHISTTSSHNEDPSPRSLPESYNSEGSSSPESSASSENTAGLQKSSPPSSVMHEDEQQTLQKDIGEPQSFEETPWKDIDCEVCKEVCTYCLIPNTCSTEEARTMMEVAHSVAQLKLPSRDFLKPIQFARTYPDFQSAVENQSACVIKWDQKVWSAIQEGGIVLPEIFIIEESFADTGRYTPLSLAEKIDSTYGGLKQGNGNQLKAISLRRGNEDIPKAGTISEFTNRLRKLGGPSYNKGKVNALSLPVIMDATSPEIMKCDRFSLLKRVIRRQKAAMAGTIEKQLASTPYDVESCESFSIFGDTGVFSGMHQDFLGGTWLRNLFGIKLWWFVPEASDDDRKKHAEYGAAWDPGDKARALIIRPDQVLVMPKHIPHAVVTIEPCLMEGGMFWDREQILETLEGLSYTVMHGDTTNEAVPFQLPGILESLEDMVESTEGWDEDSEAVKSQITLIKESRCDCEDGGICGATCPCRVRYSRCTQWCFKHSTLPYGQKACMKG